MFQLFRTYASVVVLAMMSLFAVCLIADEWGDMQRAWEDMQIEAMAEIEVEDFEWDEDGSDNWDGRTNFSPALSQDEGEMCMVCLLSVQKTALQSDEQKRGLVRRYAPRKGIARANYILT